MNDEDKSELLLQNNTDTNDEIKVDVYTEEINGVIYFKDKDGKYYNTDDVMMGKKNPGILTELWKKKSKRNIKWEFKEFEAIEW